MIFYERSENMRDFMDILAHLILGLSALIVAQYAPVFVTFIYITILIFYTIADIVCTWWCIK